MAPPKQYRAPIDGSAAAVRDPVEKLLAASAKFASVTKAANFSAYGERSSALTPRNAFMLAYALFKGAAGGTSAAAEPAFGRLGRGARELVAALPDDEAAALRREAKRACARLCLRLARGAGPRANCVLEEACLHAAFARLQEPGAWDAMRAAAGAVDAKVLAFDLQALPERKGLDGEWGKCFKKALGAEGARRVKALLGAGPLPARDMSRAERAKMAPKGCERLLWGMGGRLADRLCLGGACIRHSPLARLILTHPSLSSPQLQRRDHRVQREAHGGPRLGDGAAAQEAGRCGAAGRVERAGRRRSLNTHLTPGVFSVPPPPTFCKCDTLLHKIPHWVD